ncbi:MAG: S46 family peptidase, partial [Bacteroidota bacterium]
MIKKYVAAGVTLLVFLVLTAHTNKKQEEGMYLLSDLGQIDLAKTGLKLTREELFNPNGTSLVDAIVRVGGCTGSFVSDDGLIVTNHHCAFGFVQQISSTKNNYIRDGFLARTRGEETLAKGLVCKITASYADVSAEVLAGANELTDPNQRLQLIGKNIRAITERENKQYPGLQCEISEMFTGRTYV